MLRITIDIRMSFLVDSDSELVLQARAEEMRYMHKLAEEKDKETK